MTPATHNRGNRDTTDWRVAALDLLAGGALLFAVSMSTAWLLLLPPIYPLSALCLYGVLAVVVVAAKPPVTRGFGLGPANRVTLVRASLILPLAPLVWHTDALPAAGFWLIVALGTTAMILDGVDGWLARRTGSGTPFGARFDMELDTLLMFILALLVWRTAKVGPWVVLLGSMRYAFVAAGYAWTWLRGALPPSFRRKTACVIQGIVLLVCLGPVIPDLIASCAAALGLATVVYSFAVDVRWLHLHRASSPTTHS